MVLDGVSLRPLAIHPRLRLMRCNPASPDLRLTIEDQIAEGDKVATRGSVTGTHMGQLEEYDRNKSVIGGPSKE